MSTGRDEPKIGDRTLGRVAHFVSLGDAWAGVAIVSFLLGAFLAFAPVKADDKKASDIHWSFRPVRSPDVSKPKDSSWVKNPIDAFVLNSLEQKTLKPAPSASKLTLLRRAKFDLLGLPPTREEIDQ